eukprot:m.58100 g.58100  ORF g.58100 m.58100 type:complete len:379 (+) comp22499_c0_seq1:65-1201(+)
MAKTSKAMLALVHGVLFLICGFGLGCGTVVGKIGLHNINPLVFALYRQLIAAPIVSVWSISMERKNFSTFAEIRKDAFRLFVASVCMFISNSCYTVAVKMSNPVIGAAWQTTVPVFTVITTIVIGWEKATVLKIGGIAMALAGALFLVFYGSEITSGSNELIGNVLFFCNVNAYANYGLLMKSLLRRHPPLFLTAFSFWAVSIWLGVAVVVVESIPGNLTVITGTEADPFAILPAEGFALAYFVIVYSVLMYSVVNWANQYVAASSVMVYHVVEPLAAGMLSYILIKTGFAKEHNVELHEPGLNSLGAIGVLIGLLLIVRAEVTQDTQLVMKKGEKNNDDDKGGTTAGGTGGGGSLRHDGGSGRYEDDVPLLQPHGLN